MRTNCSPPVSDEAALDPNEKHIEQKGMYSWRK